METPPKLTLLLYDASWGLSVLRPAEHDPIYQATSDRSRLPYADAVLFHVPTAPSIRRVQKYPGQKWVAYSMESDVNYPRLGKPEYMAQFDFSMTYRWDSDVPLMYCAGDLRSRLLEPPKPKTAAAEAAFFASNLNALSGRSEYVRELMRYIDVDCYGRVLRNRELPRDEGPASKLETIARYRFDLAFENSISPDYVTEKFFEPLMAGSVPVYRGALNIEEFAPGDHCYINTADFHGPQKLADYLRHLSRNPAEYEAYFAWKKRPFRESFLRKIDIAERDPFRRLCDHMLARGGTAQRAAAAGLQRSAVGL